MVEASLVKALTSSCRSGFPRFVLLLYAAAAPGPPGITCCYSSGSGLLVWPRSLHESQDNVPVVALEVIGVPYMIEALVALGLPIMCNRFSF